MSDSPIIRRNRTQYARSIGDPIVVTIPTPIEAALELPSSYATALLSELQQALRDDQDSEYAQLNLDIPFSLRLSIPQVKKLVAQIAGKKT